ncbi:MAG: alcohol dehydrogenase catalytic domain-containing protein, partial [Nitrospinaceae bacterium]
MKALVLDVPQEKWEATTGMTLASVEDPCLNEGRHPEDAGKVIIKPRLTGFCGSDKSIWFRNAFKDLIYESLMKNGAPHRICGHELLGEIVETGSYAASHYGYKAGDMVSTESHIFCGRCHQCRIGEEHVCVDQKIIGISTDGCFAEYVKLPAKELWKTDTDKIRPEVAAIQEPLGNAVHACSRVDLRGKSVAVFGCGTIGLFSLLVARAMGAAFLVGVDPNPVNLQRAEALGADLILQVDREAARGRPFDPDEDQVDAIRRQCRGEGVDVAMEMAGSNPA